MTSITSFFMALIFSILSFFGIPFESPDLATSPLPEVSLNDEEKAVLESVFATETAWLASLQLENGAIPMTYKDNGELTVNPYFACYAALALLDDAEQYSAQVKKYLDWHFAHLNTSKTDYAGIDGTIYDYKVAVENGVIVNEKMSERKYDSSDSYAALLLTLLNKYYKTTGDAEYIISKSDDIARVVNAMTATMHNGLAFACPDYRIKFLMDNSEVYEGAVKATELFETVICKNDNSHADTLEICRDTADAVGKAIENKMWNRFDGYYRTALDATGRSASTFSWNSFYPSVTSQLFTISCGVIAPETARAKHIYNKSCESFDWEYLDFPSEYCWGSVVLAAAKMNDTDRVVTYMQSYQEAFGNHEYPLFNADSARVAMAAHIILEKAA